MEQVEQVEPLEPLEPCSLDNGYGSFKGCNPRNEVEVSEPSVVVIDDKKLFQDGQSNFTDIKTGAQYLVGAQALHFGQVSKGSIDSSYIESDEYRIQGLYALDKMSVKNAYLVTGLPVEFYADHRRKLESLIEQWESSTVKIGKCVAVPQPMGTLVDVSQDWDGVINLDLTKKRVGIIDIGQGTIDGIEAYDNQIVREKYKGKSEGISRLHEEMLVYMNKSFNEQKHKLHEMDGYLRNNNFYYKGDAINFLEGKNAQEIKKLKKNMIKKVKDLIDEIWPDGTATLFKLVFTGGGADILREELIKAFPAKQVVIPEEPSMSNARGFSKLALRLASQYENG